MDKTTVVLIHGFGGGVHEVAPLARELNFIGYNTLCPKLAGHDEDKKAFRRSSYKEWIQSVEEEIIRLQLMDHNIILVGFSMGGLIAVELSNKYKIEALVTINTPIYYWDFNNMVEKIKKDHKSGHSNTIKEYSKNIFRYPITSLINFNILLRKAKKHLKSITCPTLILQSEDDDAVNKESAKYIYDFIESDQKQVKMYKAGGHVILKSHNSHKVILDIRDFIFQIA